MYTVLLVDNDGSSFEKNWSADAVESLVLPVDALALAPRDVSDRPLTKKSVYSLSYSVQPAIKIDLPAEDGENTPDADAEETPPAPEPEWVNYATTSPQGLALALFAWLIGLGARNMLLSGSPFELSPKKRHRIKEQQATGQPTQKGRSRSYTGAPQQQGSRKKKRRPR